MNLPRRTLTKGNKKVEQTSDFECSELYIAIIGSKTDNNQSQAELSRQPKATRDFLHLVRGRCAESVHVVELTNPTDAMFEAIGIHDNSRDKSIKGIILRGEFNGNMRHSKHTPLASSVYIEGDCHSFIEGATSIQKLALRGTKKSLPEISGIITKNNDLDVCDIETTHNGYVQMHDVLYNLPQCNKKLRLFVNQSDTTGTGDYRRPIEIIVDSNRKIVKTDDFTIPAVYSDQWALSIISNRHLRWDQNDRDYLKNYFGRSQFDLLSVNLGSTQYFRQFEFSKMGQQLNVPAFEIVVGKYKSICMNNKSYHVNVEDSEMIKQRGIPSDLESLRISVNISVPSQAHAVQELFKPIEGTAFPSLSVLTVVRDRINSVVAEPSPQIEPITKSLLSLLTSDTIGEEPFLPELREYVTHVFTEDSMDAFSRLLLETRVQRLFIVAKQNEIPNLKRRWEHLVHLELDEWQFQLNESENCLIGTKVKHIFHTF